LEVARGTKAQHPSSEKAAIDALIGELEAALSD